ASITNMGATASYTNHNLFEGAENLTLSAKWIAFAAKEFSGEAQLTFPYIGKMKIPFGVGMRTIPLIVALSARHYSYQTLDHDDTYRVRFGSNISIGGSLDRSTIGLDITGEQVNSHFTNTTSQRPKL